MVTRTGLREQDVIKIVDTFNLQLEILGIQVDGVIF